VSVAFNVFFEAFENFFDDIDDFLNDSAFWAEFSCAIYCGILPDRSITEENLSRVTDRIRAIDSDWRYRDQLANLLDGLGAVALSESTLLGIYTQYNCSDCECEEEPPGGCENCGCEDCVTGTPTVYEETATEFTWSAAWGAATVSGEGCYYNNSDSDAWVELDLGECKCVKSITIRKYENVAHTAWLAYDISFPDTTVETVNVSYDQPSTGWANNLYTFTTPVCVQKIRLARGAAAGGGNIDFWISRMTVNTCDFA
jgi:hypothetical protein